MEVVVEHQWGKADPLGPTGGRGEDRQRGKARPEMVAAAHDVEAGGLSRPGLPLRLSSS